MHWILQEGFFQEAGWETLLATLERFAIPYSVHSVVPKEGRLNPEPALSHRNAICLGSYSMRHAARRYAWVPGVFDLFEHDFTQQRARWGNHLLNAHANIAPLHAVRFSDEEIFIRPTHDTKHFSGRVFTREEFSSWQARICAAGGIPGTSLTPDTEVQYSRPVQIYAEYRFWIVAGEIITQSMYRRGTQVFYSDEIDGRLAHFVQQRVREWSPAEAFVIDICETAEGLRIVEINTLNSAGFYAANVQSLVLALEERFTV